MSNLDIVYAGVYTFLQAAMHPRMVVKRTVHAYATQDERAKTT